MLRFGENVATYDFNAQKLDEMPLKMKDGRQGENHQAFSPQDIRFTQQDGVLYAFVLAPPSEDILIKTLATGGLFNRDIASVELMGSDEKERGVVTLKDMDAGRQLSGEIEGRDFGGEYSPTL